MNLRYLLSFKAYISVTGKMKSAWHTYHLKAGGTQDFLTFEWNIEYFRNKEYFSFGRIGMISVLELYLPFV